MRLILLSLLFLVVSERMARMSATELNEEIEHLIQRPAQEPDVMSAEFMQKDGLIHIDVGKNSPILTTLWVFSLFLIIASMVKLGYHQSYFLSATIPESCLLIMIGIGFGIVIKVFTIENMPKFTVDLFFFLLMPPIILDSAFSLYNEYFFENVVTILMFAIMGTLINEFLIGVFLGLINDVGIGELIGFPKISIIELLTFSNAISAVDPVTVLTIFHDLKVNKSLYYLVFGESLLNDAVVIVVHSLLENLISEPIISSLHLILGFTSFFYTSVGGFLIGVIFGLMTALLTLYTRHSIVIEPMIMIAMAYCSFLTADMISWSGLISLIGCGLVQYEFAFENISYKTRITVKYFIVTISSVSDLLIFFFLGQMLINQEQEFNFWFIALTITFCLLFRSITVATLAYISNNYFHRTRPIKLEEQALMAYGGLRGAVAFAMIALLEENKDIENFRLLKTTTFMLILFSVFVLGATTKPILNILPIQRELTDSKKITFVVNDKVIDIVIDGIEDFVGNTSAMNYLKHKIQVLIKFLKRYLCNKDHDKIEQEIPKLLGQSATNLLHSIDNSIVKEQIDMPDQTASGYVEDFPKKTEQLAKLIQTNESIFLNIAIQKLEKNPFLIEEVNRKHTLPKQLVLRLISKTQKYKSSNKKSLALKSEANRTELIQRFKKVTPLNNQIEDDKTDKNINQNS